MKKKDWKEKPVSLFLCICIAAFAFLFGRMIGSGYDKRLIDSYKEQAYQEGYSAALAISTQDASESDYEVGFAAGYAEGHREAQTHSEGFEELLRQAYRTTGGKGAGFREEDGTVYVEETTPSGRKVWVIFEP